jgi:glycosyltransferase involved in cell wall biosynthesis
VRIAVNTRLLLKNRLEGIGWFSFEVLRRMVQSHKRHEFLFIFDRPWHPEFIFSDNITPVAAFPPARHPVLWYGWFEYALPRIFKKYKPDLFFSPDGYTSLRSKIPAVTVIHDLNFEHFTGDMPASYRAYYRYFTPKYAHKSQRILTVSEYTKTELHRLYQVPEDKIDVVYNGVQEGFVPLTPNEVQIARKKFAGGSPYLVFVGSLHPRKNIVGMLNGFSALAHPSVRLLLVGSKRWWTSGMEAAARPLIESGRLIMPGHLPPQDLYQAVGGAEIMLYPSLFEGFGVPVLEGMQAGVPVLTSNTSSLPEIAGGAALLVNPEDTSAIAQAMQHLLTDRELRRSLIEKGKIRARQFNWDQSARLVWEGLERGGVL